MERWFLYAGIALCLFSLWAIGRRDWVRLRSVSRSVDGVVIEHRINQDAEGVSYAAVFRFEAEAATHTVIDQVYHGRPQPPVGTRVALSYPIGRPDLARPPRPAMWVAVYGLLLLLLGILVAKALGALPD